MPRKSGVCAETLLTLSDGRRRGVAGFAGGVVEAVCVGENLKAFARGRFAVEPAGVAECSRVRTRLGHELVGSDGLAVLGFGGPRKIGGLVAGDRVAVARRMPAFGERDLLSGAKVEFLAFMTAGGSLSEGGPPVYQAEDPEVADAFGRAAAGVGEVKVEKREGVARYAVTAIRGDVRWPGPNDAALFLKVHGLWGKRLSDRRVPEAIFSLRRPSLALYLGRLWSVMGAVGAQRGPGGALSVRAGFYTSSRGLCDDVQHLLSRFGVVSRAKLLPSSGLWLAAVSEAENVRTLWRYIGEYAIGEKRRRLCDAAGALPAMGKGRLDVIPADAWAMVERARRREGKTRGFVKAAGGVAYGRSNITRSRLALIADALGDDELRALAGADVVWDEVSGVTDAGPRETFGIEPVGDVRAVAGGLVMERRGARDEPGRHGS